MATTSNPGQRPTMRTKYASNGINPASTARRISRAALAFNLGLRSYYFGLAFLIWFLNPWFFALATTWVVGVLYRREFKSNVLQALVRTYNA